MRFFAQESSRTLVLADTLLQTETIWETKEGILETILPLNFRFDEKVNREIVSTVPEEGFKWKPITTELERAITKTIAERKNVFLFTLRKGLAPFTICNDCKKTLLCKTCDTPLTLYKESGEKRIFVCHTCRDTTPTLTKCPYCDSWNLTPLGVGTEHIEEYLQERFPDTPIYILDKTHANTKTQAKKILKQFEEGHGSILIGTESVLHYQLGKVPLVAITSFDSLFAIPSFRIHERILHLLIHLESLAEERFLIQTKNINSGILQTCRDNTFIQYYNTEITERESFNYPPFTVLVKIIPDIKTEKAEVKKIAEKLFGFYDPSLFMTTYNKKKLPAILLKIPRDLWNPTSKQADFSLREALSGLPPSWVVQVDPEQT